MSEILLVEDDKDIVKSLEGMLSAEGFKVVVAMSQKEALQLIDKINFDLALLDISLPDGSGYGVCSAIKVDHNETPIIFLTAHDDELSAVTGLDMGADDYITKPFRSKELISRIKNALKRAGKTKSLIEVSGLKVDSLRGTVHKNGNELFLSVLEYRLLLVFLANRGRVLSRDKLLEEVWDIAGEYVNDNTLTVYIKRIREKIEDDPQEPNIIKTVRGLGYKVD